jgi:hypothetical protein
MEILIDKTETVTDVVTKHMTSVRRVKYVKTSAVKQIVLNLTNPHQVQSSREQGIGLVNSHGQFLQDGPLIILGCLCAKVEMLFSVSIVLLPVRSNYSLSARRSTMLF